MSRIIIYISLIVFILIITFYISYFIFSKLYELEGDKKI